MPSSNIPDASDLWPLLPPWLNWLAQDEDGKWFAYCVKPTCGMFSAGWLNASTDKYWMRIPSDYYPSYSGDWKDSLCERPAQ